MSRGRARTVRRKERVADGLGSSGKLFGRRRAWVLIWRMDRIWSHEGQGEDTEVGDTDRAIVQKQGQVRCVCRQWTWQFGFKKRFMWGDRKWSYKWRLRLWGRWVYVCILSVSDLLGASMWWGMETDNRVIHLGSGPGNIHTACSMCQALSMVLKTHTGKCQRLAMRSLQCHEGVLVQSGSQGRLIRKKVAGVKRCGLL